MNMMGTMIYDLATLSGPLLKLGEIDSGAQKWMAEAETGRILGRWRTDIGTLGRIILLREFEELSYREISDIARVPVGTVMSRLARARGRLQECMAEAIR